MKKKLTITLDADVIPIAKRYARSRGVSLSSLIEPVVEGFDGGKRAILFFALARQVSARAKR